MLKKILAILAMLTAAMAFAAVDANKATVAELDGVKGIGPSISSKILDERKKGNFKDWNDLIERVKGVGEGNAAKFSAGGLTVNGSTFNGAAAPAAAPAAKKDAKAAPVMAAAPAAPMASDAKADAKKAKADAKKAKADMAAADKPAAAASAAKK
jgi:competence protein ComEA